MSERTLAGKKVALVVESQYIPGEIRLYQERFASYGAQVDLVSRLWGKPKATFYSTVDPESKTELETLEVTNDFDRVNLDDYAAVVVAANYTSVRLRWSEREDVTTGNAAEVARNVPAARFLRKAMQNPKIIKGLPCHALWLLTPSPDVLAGRKVVCNKVVLADVLNAGGIYTPRSGVSEEKHVVVDRDLVTSTSWKATAELVDRIRDLIIDPPPAARVEAARSEISAASSAAAPRDGQRRILMVLSEWGYWGEELVGPLEEFDRAGYRVDFCTPTGRRPNAIPVSMDADFFDPPLNRPVTTEAMAAKVRIIDDPATEQGKRLSTPISLADWVPARPYHSMPNFVRLLEAYNTQLVEAKLGIDKYDAILIVGGSGPLVDLCNNQRLHDLILGFVEQGKPVGAECYGVTCLAFARDMNLRQSIIWGKHVTGHCLEYDYKDGTGFVQARNEFLPFNMGPAPYPLEFILRDATGPEGGYHGNFGHPLSVIVDYPFVTGRSTPDSILTGQKMIEVLDAQPPLRRWGW
jgi:putative intracellular protease/amidase